MKPVIFRSYSSRRFVRGLSLVEILVALVIGLVVIGAVLANYLGSGVSGRNSSALAQMTEDASVALNLIRGHVALAGYSRPYATGGTGEPGLKRNFTGEALYGCDGGNFADAKKGLLQQLTCGKGASDAIAVAYEADDTNALPVKTSGGVDTLRDCVGAALALTPAAGAVPAYHLAEARFYVSNESLLCQGNGSSTAILPNAGAQLSGSAAPLVENIVDMQIRYGIAPSPGAQVVSYVDADDLATTPTDAKWNKVRAVRVCVVVASANEVLEEKTPYYGCFPDPNAGQPWTTPADRRMYRAFTTTIMLQNRLGG